MLLPHPHRLRHLLNILCLISSLCFCIYHIFLIESTLLPSNNYFLLVIFYLYQELDHLQMFLIIIIFYILSIVSLIMRPSNIDKSFLYSLMFPNCFPKSLCSICQQYNLILYYITEENTMYVET